ncbi:MAG: hypothetical protein JW973_16655 [Bacteroidales bacterium]|nr:hypothetical protein [Bacteroidales bacterium]
MCEFMHGNRDRQALQILEMTPANNEYNYYNNYNQQHYDPPLFHTVLSEGSEKQ